MVRKQSLNETADFQLGVEKDTSCTQLDYIQSQPRTTSQSTTYKMNQEPKSMCTECKFDLKNPSDLAIHLTERHQQQKHLYQCLTCSYKTKAIKNLREHEGGQHNKYEENINFVKETGTENPFKCMKCDHRTYAKAYITRHLFTKTRASFYLRLPAGHDKSEGFLAQISCVVAIHFIPNLACVIFT